MSTAVAPRGEAPVSTNGLASPLQPRRPVTPSQAVVALVQWMRQTGNTGPWAPDHIDMFWRIAARKYNLEHISPVRVREAFASMAKPEVGIAFEGVIRVDTDKRFEQIREHFPSRQRCTVYTVLPLQSTTCQPLKSTTCKVDQSRLQLLVGTERSVTGERPQVARKNSKRGRKPKNDNSRPGVS